MKRQALKLTLGLLVFGLTACSPQMNQSQADEALIAAHTKCSSQHLKSEIPGYDIKFEATSSRIVYSYWIKDQPDTRFVRCVSVELFGSDLTDAVHNREEKLSYEKGGGDASLMDDFFISIHSEKWDKPLEFARFDGGLTTYHFYWLNPD